MYLIMYMIFRHYHQQRKIEYIIPYYKSNNIDYTIPSYKPHNTEYSESIPGGFSYPNHTWNMDRVFYHEPPGPPKSEYTSKHRI